jgi:hypothetical protein
MVGTSSSICSACDRTYGTTAALPSKVRRQWCVAQKGTLMPERHTAGKIDAPASNGIDRKGHRDRLVLPTFTSHLPRFGGAFFLYRGRSLLFTLN